MELARAGGSPAEALLDDEHISTHRSVRAGRRKKSPGLPSRPSWGRAAPHRSAAPATLPTTILNTTVVNGY